MGDRPTGPYARVFLNGDEAVQFLAQHKLMATSCESMAKSMRDVVEPQLKTIGERLETLEHGEAHAAGDRAELARLAIRVNEIEQTLDERPKPRWPRWQAIVGVAAISLVMATAAIAIAHTLVVP